MIRLLRTGRTACSAYCKWEEAAETGSGSGQSGSKGLGMVRARDGIMTDVIWQTGICGRTRVSFRREKGDGFWRDTAQNGSVQ